MNLSFRSREYYKDYDDWDKTGIDIAFWKGHEKSDLIIRSIIMVMILFDIYSLVISLLPKNTFEKSGIIVLLLFLLLMTFPFKANLTVLHLEYKRIDIFTYKALPLLKPFLINEQSVYLKDFLSASLRKSIFRFSPYWLIKLTFSEPNTVIKIPFRYDLPYKLHHKVYYKLNKRVSAEVKTTLQALIKFYPYLGFKDSYEHLEYRYLILLSYFLAYFIFSLILPLIIS